MKSHPIQFPLIPITCLALTAVFATACSEQTVEPDAQTAVSGVESAADEAIEQAKEAIKVTEELTPGATAQDKAVADAVEKSAIAAADELEARASDAAAKIKKAVRDAKPDADAAPEPKPDLKPQP